MKTTSWDQFDKIVAFTTHRNDGVSPYPFESNNLAFHVGDKKEFVLENRQILLSSLGIDASKIVLTHQSHSDIMLKVSSANKGAGYDSFESGIEADALYTYEKQLMLGIFNADCVPVFLFDKKKNWIAIIHAGTAGTLKKITYKAIETLKKNELSNPNDIYAFLGPSLDFEHNSVTKEEKRRVLALDPDFIRGFKETGGTIFLDAPLLNFLQLRKCGIPQSNITLSNIDTFSNPKNFFSTRRDPITGRHLSIIMIK